jgi:hypothetical protein
MAELTSWVFRKLLMKPALNAPSSLYDPLPELPPDSYLRSQYVDEEKGLLILRTIFFIADFISMLQKKMNLGQLGKGTTLVKDFGFALVQISN